MPPHKVSVRAINPTTLGGAERIGISIRPPKGTTHMHLVYNVRMEVLAVLLAADDETLERMSEAVLAVLD